MTERIVIAAPHGFCAGVARAVTALTSAVERYGAPVYVNHPIVHNHALAAYFEKRGVVTEPDIARIPEGSVLVLSAHGVTPAFREEAKLRGLRVVDAVCPLVTKVHMQAGKAATEGREILVLGKKGHQELIGIQGVAQMTTVTDEADIALLDGNAYVGKEVLVLTQTTLSPARAEELSLLLREKIPHLVFSSTVCYASRNRQAALRLLAEQCEVVLVIGSPHSSNANELCMEARKAGRESMLVENAAMLPEVLPEARSVGLTSGASVPEHLFAEVLGVLTERYPESRIETLTAATETVSFPSPLFP